MRGECWGAHCLVTLLFLAEGNAKSSLRLWLSKKLNWLGWWLQLWNSKHTFCTPLCPTQKSFLPLFKKVFLKAVQVFHPKCSWQHLNFSLWLFLSAKGACPLTLSHRQNIPGVTLSAYSSLSSNKLPYRPALALPSCHLHARPQRWEAGVDMELSSSGGRSSQGPGENSARRCPWDLMGRIQGCSQCWLLPL